METRTGITNRGTLDDLLTHALVRLGDVAGTLTLLIVLACASPTLLFG
jgi:hypothetical protein